MSDPNPSTPPAADAPPADQNTPPADPPGAEHLGDAGKRALDAMKGERNDARAALKAFTDLGLTPDQIKALTAQKPADGAPVDEKAIEQRVRDAVEQAANERIAKSARSSEVRAQAAELGFVKPAQALALIPAGDLEKVPVNEDGEPDRDAVKALLTALATDSPHLLKPTDTTPDHRAAGIGSTSSGTKPDVRPGGDRLRRAYAESQ